MQKITQTMLVKEQTLNFSPKELQILDPAFAQAFTPSIS
jgi:hypothetical protein